MVPPLSPRFAFAEIFHWNAGLHICVMDKANKACRPKSASTGHICYINQHRKSTGWAQNAVCYCDSGCNVNVFAVRVKHIRRRTFGSAVQTVKYFGAVLPNKVHCHALVVVLFNGIVTLFDDSLDATLDRTQYSILASC